MTDTPNSVPLIPDESLLSPFMAAKHGLDDEQTLAFLQRFNRQSHAVRSFVTSMDTFAAVRSLVASGIIPSEFAIAIAKLVTFLAFDEVQSSQLPVILGKIGVSNSLIPNITQSLTALLKPLSSAVSGSQASPPPQPTMKPLPPLTQRIGAPATATPGPQAPARNIIDLRTTQNS